MSEPVILGDATLYQGDCLEVLRGLPDASVQCCVTSPPYYGLRDYGHHGQIGLESTPDEYVARLVAVFREVRRVLRDDGTLWLNLGDSYANGGRKTRDSDDKLNHRGMNVRPIDGAKPKDLLGIPWRVAFALQADSWYLRQDIIWHKPNPMPESVRDRCTKAHEYLFLLSKAKRYFFDSEAMKEKGTEPRPPGLTRIDNYSVSSGRNDTGQHKGRAGFGTNGTRNRRSVWTVATKPYTGAHFAVMPPALVEPCILAGSRPGDTILDPFSGSGTVAAVATSHGRRAIGIDLNADYHTLARARIAAAKRQAVLPLEPIIQPEPESEAA